MISNKHDSNAQNCGISQGTAKSSSSSDGRPRLANASGDESMDCEQAEAESEEKSAEAEYLEKSDIELPNNSPNGTTTTSTVEKLRKWFLDKIDTFKNTTYLVDDETTMSTALKQLKNIQLMLHKSCSSTHSFQNKPSQGEVKDHVNGIPSSISQEISP